MEQPREEAVLKEYAAEHELLGSFLLVCLLIIFLFLIFAYLLLEVLRQLILKHLKAIGNMLLLEGQFVL